jgi:death-on-curing protein
VPEKAAALAYSLISNHPFVDGNKRLSHAALEVFLLLNGQELECPIDAQEAFWLELAAGKRTRNDLVTWVQTYSQTRRT